MGVQLTTLSLSIWNMLLPKYLNFSEPSLKLRIADVYKDPLPSGFQCNQKDSKDTGGIEERTFGKRKGKWRKIELVLVVSLASCIHL